MSSKPRGDKQPSEETPDSLSEDWRRVLAHRLRSHPDATGLDELIRRYTDCGIGPKQVHQVLTDGGDGLYQAATSGEPHWADQFGGPLGAALLAAEVSTLASHLNSRASGVRSVAVEALLEDYSAITVAAELGVSRQKVYDIGRNGLRGPHIQHVPWRQP
ncbi:hypothetical protein [Nesterenkonia muleiensis]|uniref:hypothetical protein n=1 Tax=Nesterenkonia muleiensis TaxID=2282648 RepID=UPI000E7155B7|nr:hypothetical protein [Nesterenkonia muleiensis]